MSILEGYALSELSKRVAALEEAAAAPRGVFAFSTEIDAFTARIAKLEAVAHAPQYFVSIEEFEDLRAVVRTMKSTINGIVKAFASRLP